MARKIVFVTVGVLFLLGNLNLSEAQPRIKRGVIQRPSAEKRQGLRITDNPVIREFSITPGSWLLGQSGDATISWRVEPFPGGTRITRVNITKTSGSAPGISVTGTNATGQHDLRIPSSIPQGKTTYAITATNEAGNTSTGTFDFEVITLNSLKERISLVTFATEPFHVMAGSESFQFHIRLRNSSQLTISGVDLKVGWVNFPLGYKLDAKLTDQVIAPGLNTYQFTTALGMTTLPAGHYKLTVNAQGQKILSAEADLEVVRTVNYYRLKPRE